MKREVRTVFVFAIAVSVALLLNSYTSHESVTGKLANQSKLDYSERPRIAGNTSNVTVIATSQGKKRSGKLAAISADGKLLYHEERYNTYWDVDPVESEWDTVEYIGVKTLEDSKCGKVSRNQVCYLNTYRRVDLRTGENKTLFRMKTHGKIHDIDRVGNKTLLIADIAKDRIYVHNLTSGVENWGWNPKTRFSLDTGGFYPTDWTHVNNVDYIRDRNWITASLRNQDTVAVIHREHGYLENWSLGAEGKHSILYEQHNPDFIPREKGGPAFLIGDSENNRVIEYQRRNGTWKKSWVWRDSRTRWPRDADRLPGGNTLVTDSNGNRVLEVNEQGEIVWSLPVKTPYEAERLGTGDESSGGSSAERLGLKSRVGSIEKAGGSGTDNLSLNSFMRRIWVIFQDLVPSVLLNGVLFVLPAWIGIADLVPVGVIALVLVFWPLLEFRWSSYSLRSPVSRKD